MSTRHLRSLCTALTVAVAAVAIFALSGCSGTPKPAASTSHAAARITSDAVAVIAQLTKVGPRTNSTILEVPIVDGEATSILDVTGQIDGVQISDGGGRMSYVEQPGKLWMLFGQGARPKLIAQNVSGRGIWAPAKPHLAYVTTTDASHPVAYVYDAPRDARTALDLAKLGKGPCEVAGWYSDGTALVIGVDPMGTAAGYKQLYGVDIATGRVSKIGENMSLAGFTADHTMVVTQLMGPAKWRIESVTSKGVVTPLVSQLLPSPAAAVSPNGTLVAFGAGDAIGSVQLQLAGTDGTAAEPITTLSSATEITPMWSGDNRTVVFSWRDDAGALRMSVCDTKTRVTLDLLASSLPAGTTLTSIFGVAP